MGERSLTGVILLLLSPLLCGGQTSPETETFDELAARARQALDAERVECGFRGMPISVPN